MDEAVQRIRPKLIDIHNTFTTTSGKRVLELLEKEFDATDMVEDDPHMTYYNLGQRDVVRYIKTALNAFKNLENDQ